ncbi:MAG: thioredoxin family protein [Melioribacteraceae bacterium]|nr:thioredoxin family protein [Melioribacteraceae bacterium]
MNNKIKFLQHIKKIGISFDQFNKDANIRAIDPIELAKDELQQKLHDFTKLNQRRTARILKSYKAGNEIKEAVSKISKNQTWLITTEDWCGDSAQNIPYLLRMTESNPHIEFNVIYRDTHLDIIDKYLTNDGRAIPIIIGFDDKGDELFQWGPRPEIAKQLVKDLKEAGYSKEEFNEKLHLWYGKDRGKTLGNEFVELLKE